MTFWKWCTGFVASLALAQFATAHIVQYNVVLNGPSESPANASPGTGTGMVTVDLDLATLRVEASFSGLTGNTTASHIHCCTAVPGVSNAGVATQLPSFTGFPLGVTAGTYDHTFDLALASTYNAAYVTANGGTVSTAMNALLAGFDAGKAYLNIHTSTFGGGEIRGFLTPIPEPASGALGAAGFAWLALSRRGRKASV